MWTIKYYYEMLKRELIGENVASEYQHFRIKVKPRMRRGYTKVLHAMEPAAEGLRGRNSGAGGDQAGEAGGQSNGQQVRCESGAKARPSI